MGTDETRAALLDAAADEFAASGYAGARVGRIADRAGVSAQLISYHFGGKAGLYRAARAHCLRRACAADPSDPRAQVVAALLAVLAEPRAARLAAWEGVGGAPQMGGDARSPLPELALPAGGGLDAAALAVMLLGAITAPVLMPREARGAMAEDPAGAAFAERYGAALRHVVARMLG